MIDKDRKQQIKGNGEENKRSEKLCHKRKGERNFTKDSKINYEYH